MVVIFQENVSFDHYFGTYPNATNTSGQPFTAKPGTPTVNGLTQALLTANPNGANPQRYDPTNINDVLTCDQDHNYSDEQAAFDGGKMDKFIADRRHRHRHVAHRRWRVRPRRHELLRRQHRHRAVELRAAVTR